MRLPFFLALCLSLPSGGNAQQPALQGYPFAKGTYFQTVQDNGLLYCTTDLGLAIWDVADPLQPALLSRYVYTGSFLDGKAVKRGSVIFLGKGRGIQAVDVSDHVNPVGQMLELGEPGHSAVFEVMDTLLFTTRGGSLITWSISDLDNPVPLDTVDLDLYSLSRTDTVLVAASGDQAYRLGVGTGTPILLDQVPVQDTYLPGSVEYAAGRLALFEEEPMNGLTMLTLYDVSVPGSPVAQDVIQDLSAGDRILYMDDSALVVTTGTDLLLYDIADPGQAHLAGTVATSWPHHDAVFDGNLMYTMSGAFGFSVFQRTGPTDFTLLATHEAGDWLASMKAGSTGYVLGEGRDSLYVLDPQAPGVGAGIHDSRAYDGLDWWVYGDLLVEMETAGVGQYELTLLRVEADGTLQQMSTIQPVHSGNTHRLGIWNGRLYWGSYVIDEMITEIYDVNNPANPVFLDTVHTWFDYGMGGMLLQVRPEQGEIRLYDAAPAQPVLLAVKNYTPLCTEGFQGGPLYPDPERALLHEVGNTCYYVIDLLDTSDVHSIGPMEGPAVPVTAANGAGVWNKILYIPYLSGWVVHIYDVGVPGFLTHMTDLSLSNFPRDLAFADSTMLVAYGGYVENYGVSSLLPDMTVQVRETGPAEGGCLYPNPAAGGFFLRTKSSKGPFTVEVRDATGRPVRIQVIGEGGSDAWISCSGLPTGLYAVRLSNDTEVASMKLVLE